MGFTKEQKFKDRIDFPTPYMRYIHGIANPDFTSTISVQIPAYCDPMLLSTIEAFRSQAANPERIHFAVCYQDDDLETLKKLKQIPHCKVKYIPKIEAPGLCAARYECHLLMDDEDFTLHSDSHMRAAKYWDVALIEQWKAIGDEKAIVSEYPHDFSPYYDKELDDRVFTEIPTKGIAIGVAKNVEPDGNIRFRGMRKYADDAFVRGMFISGGCVFGPARLDREVPSDPYSYFVADELSMNVRYYTHGYKVYHPRYMPIWHLYRRTAVVTDKKVERFNTKAADYSQRRIDEHKRMKTLFGLLDMGVDLGEFGNGSEATIEDFERESGINFRFHAIRKFGTTGKFFEEHTDEDMKWICFDTLNKTHVCRELPDVEALSRKYAKKTICVQIPSYKDGSLKTTIKSLLYRADRMNRIHFAICLQDDTEHEADILRQLPNVKVTVVSKEKMKGTGLARKECQKFYDGEDYVFLTDAHMLAVWHWDTMLIDQLERLGNEKAVISGYPQDYDITRGKALWDGTFDVPAQLLPFGIGGFMESLNDTPNLLYGNKYTTNWFDERYEQSEEYDVCGRNPGVSAAYLFAHGRFNSDVGFSEAAMYRGDECMTSILLFTKGYDVYTYRHCYVRHDGQGGIARAKYTVHGRETDNMKHEQQEFYDLVMKGGCSDLTLGTERSVDDFFKEVGVDFKNGIVYSRAFLNEPGTASENEETIGNALLRADDLALRKTKVYVFAVFNRKEGRTDPKVFTENAKNAAYRPKNIIVIPCIIDDDKPFGWHFNKVFNARKLPDDALMMIVDEGVRFIKGWDHVFVKSMRGLSKGMVWSTATSMVSDRFVDAAYVNPALTVTYDATKASVKWTYSSKGGRLVKPIICDGIVGMRAGDYRQVKLAGDMSYADYMVTYSVRLFTHGYDVKYDQYSYLYRNYCPDKLDEQIDGSEELRKVLLGHPDVVMDEKWKSYRYGNGKVRLVYDWFRAMGFVDLFHGPAGTVDL